MEHKNNGAMVQITQFWVVVGCSFGTVSIERSPEPSLNQSVVEDVALVDFSDRLDECNRC